jgi:hypothetical protein
MPTAGNCSAEWCGRAIEGRDIALRVEQHRTPDGVRAYADMRGVDGPLSQALAAGPRIAVYHRKCWFGATKVSRLAVLAARAADPSGQPGEADWREPETCEVEELRGVFGPADRGA